MIRYEYQVQSIKNQSVSHLSGKMNPAYRLTGYQSYLNQDCKYFAFYRYALFLLTALCCQQKNQFAIKYFGVDETIC